MIDVSLEYRGGRTFHVWLAIARSDAPMPGRSYGQMSSAETFSPVGCPSLLLVDASGRKERRSRRRRTSMMGIR